MGKGIGTDLAEGTVTLPVIYALREGDAQTIRRVLAAPRPSPELLEAGLEAVLATGGVAKTVDLGTGEGEAALDTLELLPSGPDRGFLQGLPSEGVGTSG